MLRNTHLPKSLANEGGAEDGGAEKVLRTT